ncbi:hypothetical protein AAE478_006573 [Parahypoxylon ruwenzoriense]
MVTKEPHDILAWAPADAAQAADLAHFRGVPWLADIIGRAGVRPYTPDLLAGLTTSTRVGRDPLVGGIMAREGGISRHVCLLAEPGVLPAVGERPPRSRSRGAGVVGKNARGSKERVGRQGKGSGRERRSGYNGSATSSSEGPSGDESSTVPTKNSAEADADSPKCKSENDEDSSREDGDREKNKKKEDDNAFPVHLDILTLGPALQGIPRTTHGGVLALLFDAVCGRVGYLHRDPALQAYTAHTNTRFLRPLIAPSSAGEPGSDKEGQVTVLVRSQICARETREGRLVVRATVEGEGGTVYAVAESMLVERMWKVRL